MVLQVHGNGIDPLKTQPVGECIGAPSAAVVLANTTLRAEPDVSLGIDSDPEHVTAEQPLGMAVILQLFTLDNGEIVLGCRVDEGTIIRSREQIIPNTDLHLVRLKRNQADLWVGRIATMRHLKREISSAGKGLECGIILDGCTVPLLPGDTLHCLERKVLKPSLE